MRKYKGFTLIELLVVIVIISLLATLVIVNVSTSRGQARDSRRKADLKTIQTALENYYQKVGHYPVTNSDDENGVVWPIITKGAYSETDSEHIALNKVNADPGCDRSGINSIGNIESGTENLTSNWIPELIEQNILSTLPKDPDPYNQLGWGPAHCYIYQSDGEQYILSAWNTVESRVLEEGDDMFNLFAGFRESIGGDPNGWSQLYICNYDVCSEPNNPKCGAYPTYEPRDDPFEFDGLRLYNEHSFTLTNMKCFNQYEVSGGS